MAFPEKKFEKLTEAIEWSGLQLGKPRQNRVDVIRQFTGYHYGDGGAPRKVPVNFLKLAVEIYVRALAARTPRALISAQFPSLKPIAKNLELAINQIPEEIGLDETLRRIVTEAMFSIGVAKVGLYTVGKALDHDYGQPFVDPITIDDYFLDMSAKRLDQIQFEGNDYYLTREEVEESGLFDKKGLAQLGSDDSEGAVIGEHGEARAEGIATGGSTTQYKKRIWLRDVWLPYDDALITYAVKSKKILREIDGWDGPERGPYIKLGFTSVPGNLLPLPPVAVWRDMHELANVLFRKLGNQADKEKTVLGFQGGDEEGANNFKTASDGEGIRYSGAEPRTLTAGGVNQTTLAFWLQCRDLFAYFAGNLDMLGGLSPQSETLGQDKLLSEAAGALLRDMSGKTVDFVREIFRTLAWYEWHDPLKVRSLEKPIPGAPDMSVQVDWTPESREGEFNVYDLDIDPYSLIDDSPSLKLQRLGMIMTQYVAPLMPEIQRQGGQLNVQRILDAVAKWADFKELEDIITFTEETQPMDQQQQQPGPPTHTVNERVSRPGATPRGKSDVLQRILMGDQPQEAEAAVLG